MKSNMSVSLAFNKHIVSNPRSFSELKKFNFICSPPDVLPVVEAGDVTTASDVVVCCMSVAAIALLVVLLVVVLLELTSHVMVLRISLFEKLLLVMD